MTEDVTVRLTGGLMGVTAGTPVTSVKDNGETLQVTADGRQQFTVKKSQLTNDLDVAQLILKRAQAAQAATDAYQAQQSAVLIKQQQAEIEFLKTHPLAPSSPTPTPH